MERRKTAISEMNARSREVFKKIVDAYVATGEPIGSRTLSQKLSTSLSSATIRNVMADLEEAGLLYSPHTSSGRLPTEAGLRIFVDGLLEIRNLTSKESTDLEGRFAGTGKSFSGVLEDATNTLSGLSNCAGIVMAPKTETPLKHIEFVHLNPGRALVIMVTAEGIVENRIIEVPNDISPSVLVEATNFLNQRLVGQAICDIRSVILGELEQNKATLDQLTRKVVQAGLATWSGEDGDGTLIVSGHANLLDDVNVVYAYGQFKRDQLEVFCDDLQASLIRKKRNFLFIYTHLVDRDVLESYGFRCVYEKNSARFGDYCTAVFML